MREATGGRGVPKREILSFGDLQLSLKSLDSFLQDPCPPLLLWILGPNFFDLRSEANFSSFGFFQIPEVWRVMGESQEGGVTVVSEREPLVQHSLELQPWRPVSRVSQSLPGPLAWPSSASLFLSGQHPDLPSLASSHPAVRRSTAAGRGGEGQMSRIDSFT
jgi:hypothetical protein